MTMKSAFAAMAAFGAALFGASALADAPSNLPRAEEGRSVIVRFDAGALADPIAVDALQRDIVRAARRVCGGSAERGVSLLARRNACMRRAVDAAVTSAAIPSLTVLHANLTNADKYRSWRGQPSDSVMRMVAEAGGQSGSAGTIFQPPQ